MKILYCPPGEDPLEYARQFSKQRRHRGGLGDSWWMIPTIAVFLVIGFTVGPLKGCVPQQPQQAEQAAPPVVVAAPIATPTPPVLCNLPTGGRIANGDTAWVDLQAKITRYECRNGQLSEIESIIPTATLSP